MKKSIEEQLTSIKSILTPKNGEKNHNGRKNPKQVKRVIWSVDAEMEVINAYLTGSPDIKNLSEKLKIKEQSIKMKLSNIEYLDHGTGLKNVSKTTKTLFEQMKK